MKIWIWLLVILTVIGFVFASVLWPMPSGQTAGAAASGERQAAPASQAAPSALAGDFPFPKQKPLFDKLGVEKAWALTKGDPNLKIGIIETGFDFFHPALKDKLIPGFYASGGYHLDIYTSVAHGTMVASIIAARGTTAEGMTGLAPDCRLITACLGIVEQPLLKLKTEYDKTHPKFDLADFQKEMAKHKDELEALASKWSSHMAVATAGSLRYLADRGIRLVNISALLRKQLIPSAEAWAELDGAFRYAASKGVLIVLGAGNNGQEIDDYPGAADAIIVVGASTRSDKRWQYEMTMGGKKIPQGSNYGKRLTVMAPSEGLMTAVPHEERFYACDDSPMGAFKEAFKKSYEFTPQGATSCATPIVTSLAALVMSLRPDLPAAEVREIIIKGSDDIGEPGFDVQTGYGRVNYAKTLELAKAWKK